MHIVINPEFSIAPSEIELTYARSSGPGGQNVNKVNSKAILRWNIYSSDSLNPILLTRILQRLKNKITSDGDILISSDRFRDQLRNREDCIEKFQALLATACVRPTIRKKTKPSRSSQRKAKAAKSYHSIKKNMRKSTRDFE